MGRLTHDPPSSIGLPEISATHSRPSAVFVITSPSVPSPINGSSPGSEVVSVCKVASTVISLPSTTLSTVESALEGNNIPRVNVSH